MEQLSRWIRSINHPSFRVGNNAPVVHAFLTSTLIHRRHHHDSSQLQIFDYLPDLEVENNHKTCQSCCVSPNGASIIFKLYLVYGHRLLISPCSRRGFQEIPKASSALRPSPMGWPNHFHFHNSAITVRTSHLSTYHGRWFETWF